MKLLLNKTALFIILCILLFATSCKKEGSLDYASTPKAGTTLTSSVTTPLVLTLPKKDSIATTLRWNQADYGVKTIVNYILQYDTVGKNFASPNEISLGTASSTDISHQTLNGYGVKSGIAVGKNGSVEFRIKAAIGYGSVLPVYSNVITLNITTYDAIVFWYVPGNYQGWSPGSAPKLGSTDLDYYEGYVNAVGGGEFKITSDPDWNHTSYGNGGGGTLSTSGGNLAFPSSGYYYITATKSTLKYKLTATTWGMIGDFNNWSTPDAAMTYDAVNSVWVINSIALTAGGGFKFRANSDWTIQYSFSATSPYLSGSGGNISVPATGNYKVVLDLSHGQRYTYTLTKL
jgi:hypothetical protein